MADLLLREAKEADVPTVVAVLHAAFEEYRNRLDPPSGVHRETVLTVSQKLTSARAVLALRNTVAIGCVVYETTVNHLDLFRLAVLPANRRAGVGRALIEYVEVQALGLNVPRIRLGVRLVLTELRAAYERLGYQPIEFHTHPGYQTPTYVILEKVIRPLAPGTRT
jgi:GNAT superfamily N-acetyltransferase